jgi:hypothetical protein
MYSGEGFAIIFIALVLTVAFILIYHPVIIADIVMDIIKRNAGHDEKRHLERWRYPVIYLWLLILGLAATGLWILYT